MNMQKKTDADILSVKYGLIGMIPSIDAYGEFKADMRKGFSEVLPAILEYAAANDLIQEKSEAALLRLLEANPAGTETPEKGRTFPDLLAQILGTKSVNSLLENLNAVADQFRMRPVQASMFSRLKKNFNPNTPKKRNALRLLAFWIGLKRPELRWNYEMLLKLEDNRPAEPVMTEEAEGVRIAFALQATGDILDLKAVDWLKSELQKCIYDLNLHYIESNKITFTLSTAQVDIPKAPGPSGEPRLYTRAIRDSLGLAYQMPIRWALSKHSSQQRSMIVAINAGPFDQADKYIQALFSAKMTGITPIRTTDFARLCAKIADIKVTFNKNVEELSVGFPGAGYTKIWQVDYFWSYLYYDFVPALLESDVMPTTREDYEIFRNELFFSDQKECHNKALSALRKFPQDSLLATEIARILIAKRMFHEADQILSIILASYPQHVVARTCRAIIYHYLSKYHTEPELSEMFFSRAACEADILIDNHSDEAEAFTEAGLLYYTRAVQLITAYRKGNTRLDRENTITQSTDLLEHALRLLNKSTAVAPITDMRAEFWVRQTRILLMMMQKDNKSLMSRKTISDKYDIVYNISRQTFKVLGWLRDDSENAYRFFQDRLNDQMKQYAEDVSVTNFSPSVKCHFAGYLWNTLPEMTVGMAKLILFLYQEAIQDVERLSGFNIGVYSASGCYTLIQTPEHFIRNARKFMALLEGVLKDDLNRPDDYLVSREKIRKVALPFALLDDEVESEIILKTDDSASDAG